MFADQKEIFMTTGVSPRNTHDPHKLIEWDPMTPSQSQAILGWEEDTSG